MNFLEERIVKGGQLGNQGKQDINNKERKNKDISPLGVADAFMLPHGKCPSLNLLDFCRRHTVAPCAAGRNPSVYSQRQGSSLAFVS